MATCTSCGRQIDGHDGAGCPACTAAATPEAHGANAPPCRVPAAKPGPAAAPRPATLLPPDDGASALMGRLRDYASLAGEELGRRELLVRRALERGNLRPYHAEVNRLADRYVDRLERAWS